MNNRRKQMPPRRMKDMFLIFCEGETEETYIDMLRRHFHAPIRIVPSVQGQNISKRLIDEYKRSMQISPADKVTTFLMYDIDVAQLLPQLQNCDAELLVSNPTFELWYLLHSADQRTGISARDVLPALRQSAPEWRNYRRGVLTDKQCRLLQDNMTKAVERATMLTDPANPSSRVYLLVKRLQCNSDKSAI